MNDDERELRLASEIRRGLGAAPASTPEARQRVMDAVRAAKTPQRASAIRSGWRSPALGLLAAASIAGVIALVRSNGISYVPAPIPGVEAPMAVASAPSEAPARNAAAAGESGVVKVQFVLVAPDAKRVAVVGDFNDWNPSATPLESAGGVWSHEEILSAGRHDYAFVIDGTRWIADPTAPRAPADELGGGYSVLVAGARP